MLYQQLSHRLNPRSARQQYERKPGKKSFISQSRKHYLVADHTKFSDTAEYKITDLKNIDMIITDKRLSDVWEDKLQQCNIPICYC